VFDSIAEEVLRMILRTFYTFTGLARPEIPSIAIATQPAE
jgi:hypothetical protein